MKRDRWLHLVKDLSVLGSKIFLLLGKNVTEHQQLHSLCLVGNQFEMVSRKLLSPAKSARKSVRALTEARDLLIELTEDRCFGKRSSEPMTFATLQAFEVFRLLTIHRLFDNLDESTTISSALPPSPTTSLFLALNAFGANNLDDPIVFNIEVSDAAILLKPWMKRQ